jgi:hypothetical protein
VKVVDTGLDAPRHRRIEALVERTDPALTSLKGVVAILLARRSCLFLRVWTCASFLGCVAALVGFGVGVLPA